MDRVNALFVAVKQQQELHAALRGDTEVCSYMGLTQPAPQYTASVTREWHGAPSLDQALQASLQVASVASARQACFDDAVAARQVRAGNGVCTAMSVHAWYGGGGVARVLSREQHS